MTSTTSYEILSQRQGKWEIEGITADKNEAINRANETLGTGHYEAVKVLAEKIDDETGESTTFTLLSKEALTGYDIMIGKANVVTSVLLSGIIIALFKGMDLEAVSIPKRGIAFQVLGMGIIAVCLSLIF